MRRGHVPGQHLPLQADDLLQSVALLVQRATPGHGAVVDATHADGVDVLVTAVLANALLPVLQDARQVRHRIPHPRLAARPLADVVAQHRLGVRRPHDDRVAIGDDLVLRVEVERPGAGVHRRPQVVGLEPQEQLEDLGVGLRADVPGLAGAGLMVLLGPLLEAPVFVVDEDAAILHRRRPLPIRTPGARTARRGAGAPHPPTSATARRRWPRTA